MVFDALVADSGGGWAGWDWLLGLRELSLEAGDVSLRLSVEVPAWGWALIALGIGAFVWWVYHRLLGGRALRLTLALLRGLVLGGVVLLLCGPEAVREEERVEADVLVMLVDRSASLNVEDAKRINDGDSTSREFALRGALEAQWPEVATGLAADREVRWLGFGERVFGLGGGLGAEATNPDLGEADQMGTRLRTAVEEAVRRVAGRAVAGVVVVSDGRSGEEVSSGLVARLGQSGVKVFTVPLGAADGGLDVAVVRVDGPSRAFAGDGVPVSVGLEVRGRLAAEATRPQVVVRLVDTADGAVLDERALTRDELRGPVRLEASEVAAGAKEWVVEAALVVDPAAASEPRALRELNEANNAAELSVEVVDRPIRVLYVEGTPRWEYRYLKNLLVREPSIDSSILLLSADADFAQEGDTPITRLPADAEEWARYDVVILGDVPAAYFGDEQVALLRERVSRAGVGLMWVAGPGYVPGGWAGTRLSDVLPMREPGAVGVVEGGFVAVEPTGLAGALSVLRLGDGAEASEVGTGRDDWPVGLGALRWVQDVGELKPTAEVLAQGRSEGLEDDLPVVTRMRYGAGQSVYVATDETWRWRRGVGERFPERFYVQLVRMLGRAAVAVDDARVRLEASSQRVSEGGSVVLDLVVSDAGLLDRGVQEVPVRLKPLEESGATGGVAGAGVELLLREVRESGESPSASEPRRFSAVWTADRAGEFVARVTHPALMSLDVQTEIEVAAADDELRNPEADHAKLIRLADATGGRTIPLDRLNLLNDPEVVPSVARRIADDRTESIAHSPLALALLLGLLALEWSARRAIRLA